MPHYIYDCKACGQPYEVFHSMQVPALVECPFCGRPELKRRILGGSGLIFKGSGFYETDYKRKPAADQKRTESGEAGEANGACKKGPGCGACSTD